MMDKSINKKNVFSMLHTSLWKIKVIILEHFRRLKYKDLIQQNRKWINNHNGESCFIVCNGPSLLTKDLERISKKGFITFGCNKIYKLFNETEWRPTYYCFCDTSLYNNYKAEIDSLQLEKFIPLDLYDGNKSIEGLVNVFSRVPFQLFNNKPKFNPNLLGKFSEGGTITYHMLQLAVAMGFKEIFLIGCDFSFSWGIGPDGKYHEDPTIKDHFSSDKTKTDTIPDLYYNLQAYKSAKKYADKHNIKIWNATRGGKLEVFDRIDVDRII